MQGERDKENFQDYGETIDVVSIEMIHGIERQQDGYVSFCAKINNSHHDLAGIKVNQLRQYLPRLLPWLLKDSFFSVNASFKDAPYKNKTTGLNSAWRKERHLRYLNACYADLDYYKAYPPLDWPSAVEIVMRAQEDGIIPPASIIGRSGRGMYLLWLLTSARQGAQQRAFPHEIELYKQINKSIYHRMNKVDSRLNADNIFDAARLLRVPGSENTKAKDRVAFVVQATQRGLAPTYTLKELAGWFGLSAHTIETLPEKSNFYNRPIKNRGSAPRRRAGRIATAKYRLEDLLTIYQHIMGFKHGKRRRSLTYFCYFAKAAGMTLGEISEGAKALARGCAPPYPCEENDISIEQIVNNVWNDKTKSFRNDKLAWFFEITPELAEELTLHSIVPATLAKERKGLPSPQKRAREERQVAIKEIVESSPGNIPSIRHIQKKLLNRGIKASRGTVNKELKEIVEKIQKCPKIFAL